jgi:hypothetical protein
LGLIYTSPRDMNASVEPSSDVDPSPMPARICEPVLCQNMINIFPTLYEDYLDAMWPIHCRSISDPST